MPTLTNLDELLHHDLGDIYDAEHRFLEAQAEMLAAATDRELKKMIKAHMAQTKGHIERLEQGYELLGLKPKRVKCPVAVGLVKEGQDGLEDSEGHPKVRDCVIACAAAKVEHYEISSYRTLVAAADTMGHDELLALFQANLAEEEEAASKIEWSTPALLEKASAKRRVASKVGV